jgi:DNA-binding MarR family transcriptional regulator
VSLTEQGVDVIDKALQAHVANMDQMLSVLDKQEQTQLAELLKKVLLAQ